VAVVQVDGVVGIHVSRFAKIGLQGNHLSDKKNVPLPCPAWSLPFFF